jgi:hypothetical protein
MSDKLRVGELVRKRPEPVPSIYPLPEYLAAGDRKDDYENTKAVLQVPWMGVVTMAFSHYRKFYRTLWPGLRPLFQSAELVACCGALRSRAEELADELSPAPLAEQLTGYGYAPRELQNIAEMIAISSRQFRLCTLGGDGASPARGARTAWAPGYDTFLRKSCAAGHRSFHSHGGPSRGFADARTL